MRRIVRPRVLAGLLAGLLGLYTLIGFFLLPYLITSYVIPAAAERLKHPIVVHEVAINPFALSLLVNGLEIREVDQTPIVGFDELFVDLRATTLFLQSVGFDEIRLVMPFVVAKVSREGKLNLLTLVPPSEEKPAKPLPEKKPADSGKMMPVEIGVLTIDKGILEFRDDSRSTPLSMDVVPIHVSLRNFSTLRGSENAYAFTAEIGKGEVLAWEGTVSLEPLESDGKLSLSGVKIRTLYQAVRDRFHFEVLNGELGMTGTYHVDLRNQTPRVTVKDGSVGLRNLMIGERGVPDPVVAIPVLDVKGVHFDLEQRAVQVGVVQSENARFNARLDQGGILNYQPLFTPVEERRGAADQGLPQGSKNEPSSRSWSVVIGEVGLRNYGAMFEDRTLARPGRVEVDALDLTVKNVQIPVKGSLPVELTMKVNQSGTVGVRGNVALDPMVADLDLTLQGIGIRQFQPYVDRHLNIDVRNGALDLNGVVRYAKDHPKGPLLLFQGNVGVKQLSIADRTEFEEVLSWKSLAVNRLTLDVEPTAVKIGEIVWQEPAVQMVIRSDGTLNLSHLLLPPSPGESETDKPQDANKKPPAASTAPVSVAIDQVKLVKASATFRDVSIKPRVKTGITELSGVIKGLSSKQIAKADVALTGKVDGRAPIKVSGKINPLSENAYTDLVITFDNVDLTAVSPYAGKYAGYPIAMGKLFLDLKYKIAKKELIGENKVLIDQLTFGDKTDSPDATSLPVPLAVALLKDRHGKIDVDLPVRGDLNDPDFKYGRALLSALLNLLAKVATSPLSLLGGLVGGGGDELQVIEFLPGQSSLSEAELKKLGVLQKVLVERPGLFLEVTGTADPQRDRVVLAERKFVAQLQELKRREAVQQAAKPGEEFPLSKEEEIRLITEWYRNEFPIQPAAPKPELSVSEQRTRLVGTMVVAEAEIRQLAQDRAGRIRHQLLQPGSVPEDRVVLREPEIKEETGSVVQTHLALAGR